MMQIKKLVSGCEDCQHFKITRVNKHGKIPLQEEEKDTTKPWQIVHVDTVGTWPVEFKLKHSKVIQTIKINALTAADWAMH
eukprot:11083221-Ditylum_brightwellii.AAC.1